MNLECLLFFPIYWHSFKYKLYYKRLVKSATKPSAENNQTQIIVSTNFCTVRIAVMNLWSFPDSTLSLSNILLHVYPLPKSIHNWVRNWKNNLLSILLHNLFVLITSTESFHISWYLIILIISIFYLLICSHMYICLFVYIYECIVV